MRDVKFRAWDKGIGKMLYNIQKLHYAFTFFDDADIPLMQYTGLADKNGKEIYEGDIVQGNRGIKGAVEYHAPVLAFNGIDFES